MKKICPPLSTGRVEERVREICRCRLSHLLAAGLHIPEVQIHLGTSLDPESIREGTDVYFDCTIDAHPSISKVEWRHSGKTLHHNISQGVIITDQSLVLQGVSRASAGNYTCVGYNTEGDGESIPFNLNMTHPEGKVLELFTRNSSLIRVADAPTCRPNQTRVHGVAKQEKVNISCEVEANPSHVTFRWMFNNSAEAVDVQSPHVVLEGTSSIVSYTPVTDLDYGTLLCWATNRIGSQRLPCVFHIIPAGRPDLVRNCSVANSSMTSFSIRCQEGYNGGLPQSFLLEVRDSSSHEVRVNMTGSYPRFAVTGLEPSCHYLVYIYSFNLKGRSEPVVTQAATLRLPEKQLTAEKERPKSRFWFTPMMSVLIGIFAALIIVAAVIVVVLRLQCSRNEDRRKRHKAAAAEQRCGGSSGSSGDKGGSSPINKLDPGGNESGDSDDKNPDIIPQPCSGEYQLPSSPTSSSLPLLYPALLCAHQACILQR
ncbi:hypothetical protein PR048_024827 [Dryococelus australis]|uniref:Uncharacterized protein n=1 Tax=Dryococelus australis TaxID=614101 RepID=A0ABQ9GPL5_9NEOP|nr:hypothetical protein PR048_024827 [Dryococelus australis]